MKNIMLDLETLGNNSNSPIISIGAVFFDPQTGDLGGDFYQTIQLESAMQHGIADAGTIQWWMQQSNDARAVFNAPDCVILTVALYEFQAWANQNGDNIKMWGNGATFDNTILANAYLSTDLPRPWKYWNDRDVRTIVELGRNLCSIDPKKDFPFEGTEHNALDDAKHQARYVSAIFQKLSALTK